MKGQFLTNPKLAISDINLSIIEQSAFEVISYQRQQKTSLFIVDDNLPDYLVKALKMKLVPYCAYSEFFSVKLLKFFVQIIG